MVLTLLLIIIGVIAGLARGGKVGNLSGLEVTAPWLVFGGLAIQIGSEITATLFYPELGRQGGMIVLGVAYAMLITFVALNRRWPGVALIGAGLLMNFAVIVANGAMPVAIEAIEAAGGDASDIESLSGDIKHQPMGPDTRLRVLGDVIPLPGLKQVVSVGDALLGAGVMLLVEKLVRYSPRRSKTRKVKPTEESPEGPEPDSREPAEDR